MKTTEIAFPLTLEEFLADQEARIGREINGSEVEAIEAALPVFSAVYEASKRYDYETVKAHLCAVERGLSECESSAVYRFLSGCQYWMSRAWEAGKEARA